MSWDNFEYIWDKFAYVFGTNLHMSWDILEYHLYFIFLYASTYISKIVGTSIKLFGAKKQKCLMKAKMKKFSEENERKV